MAFTELFVVQKRGNHRDKLGGVKDHTFGVRQLLDVILLRKLPQFVDGLVVEGTIPSNLDGG